MLGLFFFTIPNPNLDKRDCRCEARAQSVGTHTRIPRSRGRSGVKSSFDAVMKRKRKQGGQAGNYFVRSLLLRIGILFESFGRLTAISTESMKP
jgi:hypothetical protein